MALKKLFNKLFFLLFILILPCKLIFSQDLCNFSDENYNAYLCLEGHVNYVSTIKGQAIVDQILKSINIPDANFEIKTCRKINNAAAIIWNGKRVILYDDHYLQSLKGDADYWFFLFVFAHEIGHHLNGHTLEEKRSNYESRIDELECDRFAGAIIKHLGGDKKNIKSALNRIPHPTSNNSSHPTFKDRLSSAIEGFNDVASHEKKVLKKYEATIIKEWEAFKRTKIVNEARQAYISYYKTMDKEDLNLAIDKFSQAAAVSESDAIFAELANVYRCNKDYNNAILSYERAIKINPKPSYYLSAYRISTDIPNFENEKNISKIELIKHQDLSDPHDLHNLVIYYNHKAIVTQELRKINAMKAIEIAEYALNSLKHIANKNTHILMLEGELYNSLSLSGLRLENFKESLSHSNTAIDHYERALQTNGFSLTETFVKENMAVCYGNKALIEVRLKKWGDCIRTCKKIISDFKDSNEDGSVNYYLGRSYAGQGKYNEAIAEYTIALKLAPTDYYLYYYRGISYRKIGENKLACIDLSVACNGMDSKDACLRVELYCK